MSYNAEIDPWEWSKNWAAKPTHWMPLPKPPKAEPPFTDYKLINRDFWNGFFAANETSREGEYEPIGSYILQEDDG